MGTQAATHLFYYVSESAFNILVTCFQLNNPALQKNNLDLVLGIYKHHEDLASALVYLLAVTSFISILHANFHIAKETMSVSINAWPSQSLRCPPLLKYTSTLKKLTALFLLCFHIHFCWYISVNNLILFSPHKLISNTRTMHSCKGNPGPHDFKRCPSSHIKQQTNKEKYVALSYMDS